MRQTAVPEPPLEQIDSARPAIRAGAFAHHIWTHPEPLPNTKRNTTDKPPFGAFLQQKILHYPLHSGAIYYILLKLSV